MKPNLDTTGTRGSPSNLALSIISSRDDVFIVTDVLIFLCYTRFYVWLNTLIEVVLQNTIEVISNVIETIRIKHNSQLDNKRKKYLIDEINKIKNRSLHKYNLT